MAATGGLKLALHTATPRDRRVRFADVTLSTSRGGPSVGLVTDANGRMRYRLGDGEYRLCVVGGPQAVFSVRDHRWTTIRILLS